MAVGMKPYLTLPASAFAILAIGAAPTFADSTSPKGAKEHEIAREALRKGEVLPLTRILLIVGQRVPGDVIKVKLEEDDGRIEYEVKVLTPTGRVIEIELDARTGQILKTEED